MPGMPTDDGVAAVVQAVHGSPEHWTPVTEGAYSWAQRWIVRWPDGRTAFVKAAHDDYTRSGSRPSTSSLCLWPHRSCRD